MGRKAAPRYGSACPPPVNAAVIFGF
jgi:hypothetical protein